MQLNKSDDDDDDDDAEGSNGGVEEEEEEEDNKEKERGGVPDCEVSAGCRYFPQMKMESVLLDTKWPPVGAPRAVRMSGKPFCYRQLS